MGDITGCWKRKWKLLFESMKGLQFQASFRTLIPFASRTRSVSQRQYFGGSQVRESKNLTDTMFLALLVLP